jgi:hypothetical protein
MPDISALSVMSLPSPQPPPQKNRYRVHRDGSVMGHSGCIQTPDYDDEMLAGLTRML